MDCGDDYFYRDGTKTVSLNEARRLFAQASSLIFFHRFLQNYALLIESGIRVSY